MGALLVFIGFILFIGKRHFGRAFATIFGKRTSDDSNEPLPYVWAVGGLIVGVLLLTLICRMAGMSVWVALVMLGIFSRDHDSRNMDGRERRLAVYYLLLPTG